MGLPIKEILENEDFTSENIISLLECDGDDRTLLFNKSSEIKEIFIGKKVWFRGLIEFSNICSKDCLYCGIRKGNKNLERYSLSDDEILAAARFAFVNRYGSIALQSGEIDVLCRNAASKPCRFPARWHHERLEQNPERSRRG